MPIDPGGSGASNLANVIGTLSAAKGGTGVANNAASTLTISGSFATTLTVTGVTGVTLPTAGTLATIAGAEALSGKTSISFSTANPASAGQVRLSNTDTIKFRNAANNGDLTLGMGATDTLSFSTATTAADVAAATLLNAPAGAAGNPDIWFNVVVNGTTYIVPGWTP